jgi:hypothetical protein
VTAEVSLTILIQQRAHAHLIGYLHIMRGRESAYIIALTIGVMLCHGSAMQRI